MQYPDYIDYDNYKVFRNGEIINSKNNRVLTQKVIKGSHYVNLITKTPDGGNINKKVCVERLMYTLFTGDELTRMFSIVNKKGSAQSEYDIEDLIKVEKSNKHLYDSKAEGGSLFDEATCEEIRKQYDFEHKATSQWGKHGMSIRELALKYDCSPNTIQRILKGTYVAKKEKKYITTP